MKPYQFLLLVTTIYCGMSMEKGPRDLMAAAAFVLALFAAAFLP